MIINRTKFWSLCVTKKESETLQNDAKLKKIKLNAEKNVLVCQLHTQLHSSFLVYTVFYISMGKENSNNLKDRE